MNEERLNSLLLAWQDQQARGHDAAVTELCRSCPELAGELARRIEVMRRLGALMQPGSVPPSQSNTAATLDSAPAGRQTGGTGVATACKQGPATAPRPGSTPPGGSPPDYEILGELGRGGMGVVYQARQKGLNRLVALKMILAGSRASAEQMARFRTEAAAVASLQHPNIVQIYEIGEQEGCSYFSLEYVEGGSLAQKLAGAPQQPRYAAAVAQALARAMHYAHQRGIVHRDLKPANILLTAQGTPKITDFGLAKHLDEDGQTRSGDIMGTPGYMAPEQATGRVHEIGPLADVYALGAILYELLTGRPPFRGATVLETLELARSTEPLSPARLHPKVPRDLETICLKCLSKEPKKRYPSAEALADDLKRYLSNEPIQARPVSRAERVLKWAKRRPAVAALSAALALALVLGFGGVTWKWLEAESLSRAEAAQRQAAEAARQRADANATREKDARLLAQAAEARAKDREKRARDAEAEARAEAQRRRYVSDFLLNLFKSADPVGLQGFGFRGAHERGQSLTALVLLERGADRVDRDLRDQPALQATTLDTLGNTFRELGIFDRAEVLLRRSLELRRAKLPGDHAGLAATLHNLGWVHHDRGEYRKGLEYYRQAYELRKQHLGADDPATADSMFNLAWLLTQVGDHGPAEKRFRKVIALRRQHGGDNTRDVALAQVGLAALLLDQGRAPEALLLINPAVKTLTALEGDKGIGVAVTKFQQGMAAHYFRNYKAAVLHLRACLEITQRILGKEHAYVVIIRAEIGSNLAALGELAAAEQEYRAALDVTRKTVGLEHPRAVVLVEQAGELLVRRGKRSEAEGLFEELLKVRRGRFGDDDGFVAEGLQAYAAFLERRGQAVRAEALYRQALDTFRKAEVRGGRRLEDTATGLVRLLRSRGASADAEKLLRAALDSKQAPLSPKTRLALRQQLFEGLVEQNKFAEARAGLAELLREHRAQRTSGPALLEVLAQAGRVYCELGEFARGEPLFREEAKLWLAGKARTPVAVAESLRRLGLVQLAAGDADGCRQTGSRLLGRLAGTADAQAANLTVRLCTLTPAAAGDQARLLTLASRTAKHSPSPASLAALGAALCRSGKYAEAVKRLEEAQRLDTGKRFPQTGLFLALAYRRLNQPGKARAALQGASGGTSGSALPELEWEGRLEHRLLRREVLGLLEESAAGP